MTIIGSSSRIAVSAEIRIGRREIYIAPDGTAMDMTRIGQLKNGVCVSTPVLSDREISELGLTGKVRPCPCEDANRLYGRAVGP